MQPLSEQLADLSMRSKTAEDAVSAALKEGHDKIVERREKARADAHKAAEKVHEEIKSFQETSSENWNVVKAKVAADIDVLRAKVAHAKHDMDEKNAARNAERLEKEARFAIDFAAASIEKARVAVLDAIDGRIVAEGAKRGGSV
jgi:hypothetical protein